jgi:hypothetical protein
MKGFLTLVFSSVMLVTAVHSQNCDPWIQNAYQKLFKRPANAQECNIRNYNNGSWSSECELLGYVARYKNLGDPWIFQVYCELRNRVPDASELNIYNYNNGSWRNYGELRNYVTNYLYNITKERVESSYLLALGRKPTKSELQYWLNREPDKALNDHVENHRQYANGDKNTKRALIKKSYVDVLGRNPREDEISYWMKGADLYYQLTNKHLKWLIDNPAEYEKVIKRSYKAVLNREADAGELNYWKGQKVMSFALLLSCHEDWKAKNGQTARKTSGTNNVSNSGNFVQFATVSNKVASEANNLLGAAGGNLIGGAGANLIGQAGGNLIGQAGGNLVPPNGKNAVFAGGAGVIPGGGGN